MVNVNGDVWWLAGIGGVVTVVLDVVWKCMLRVQEVSGLYFAYIVMYQLYGWGPTLP